MTRYGFPKIAVIVFSAISLSTWLSLGTPAQAIQEGSLKVFDGKIYLPIPGATITAGYGTIKNLSSHEVQLQVERVEKFRAVELHRTSTSAGVARMEKVQTMTIPPNGELILRPGGNHLMLFGPEPGLKAGDTARVHVKAQGKPEVLEFQFFNRAEENP